MTVPVQIPSIEYFDDGITTDFPVPFRYNAPAHIRAWRIDTAGGVTALVYGTDYTVSASSGDAGGTLTLTAPGVDGTMIAIVRATPREQPTDYVTLGKFTASSHETALDRYALIAQEHDQLLVRTPKVAPGEEALPIGPIAEGQVMARVNDRFVGVTNDPAAAESSAARAEAARATTLFYRNETYYLLSAAEAAAANAQAANFFRTSIARGTKADLDLLAGPHEEGASASVWADGTAELNGLYTWAVDEWVKIADLPDDAAAASAAEAALSAAEALSTVATRVKYQAPLRNTVDVVQALRNRFTPTSSAHPRHAGQEGDFDYIENVENEYLWDNFGYPNAMRLHGRETDVAGAVNPRGGFVATAAQLVEAGIVPDDTTPPVLSVRGLMLLADQFNQTQNSGSQGLMYVILRYAGADGSLVMTGDGIDDQTDVVFASTVDDPLASGIPASATDPLWAGATTRTATLTPGVKKEFRRENVKIPATYAGQELTGVIIQFLGKTVLSGASWLDLMADIIPGATISATASYLNFPEDQPTRGLAYDDADDVVVTYDGTQFYYTRVRWSEAYDLVLRLEVDSTPTDNNGLWDIEGARLIPRRFDMGLIAEQWAHGPASSDLALYSGGDVTEPYRINQTWLAGGHGLPCQAVEITGHGMIVGSKWNDGAKDWVAGQVIDDDNVKLVAVPTGTDAEWVLDNVDLASATLTHVSGNPTTGDRIIASSAVSQIWPFVHSRSVEVRLDDQIVDQASTYSGSILRFRERYVLPNVKKAVEFIVANAGTPDNALTNPAIEGQIEFGVTHEIDWTGNIRIVKAAFDLLGYNLVQDNISQPKKLGINGGQTLTAYVSRTAPFDGNDFEAGVDVTASPPEEYTFTSARWADPADPPLGAVYVTKQAGVPNMGLFTLIDDSAGQGVPAIRSGLATALRISTSVKSYLYAGDLNTATGAGILHESAGVTGFFNAGADPALTWNFPMKKAGGYSYYARAPGALADHWVAIDKRFIGQPVAIARGAGLATLKSTVVSERGVLVDWSARGEVELVIGR